jgi:hypothetical protein
VPYRAVSAVEVGAREQDSIQARNGGARRFVADWIGAIGRQRHLDTLADVSRRRAEPHLEAGGFGDPGAAHIVVGGESARASASCSTSALQCDLGEGPPAPAAVGSAVLACSCT